MENNNCIICNSKTVVTKCYVQKSINKKRFFSYCDNCNHVSLVPLPTNKELDLYYLNSRAQIDLDYIKAYKKNKLLRFNELIRKYSKKEKNNILEVGPGSIGMLSIINELDNYSILEYSKENIKSVQKEADKFGKKINTYNKLEEMAEEKKFDIIICNAMLEHSNNPQIFIKDLSRFISTGGIFIIGVPDRIFEIPFLENLLNSDEAINFNEQHLHSFSSHSLAYLFESMDYTIIATENMLPEFYLKTLKDYINSLNKLVSKQLVYSIRNIYYVIRDFTKYIVKKKLTFSKGDDRNEFFLICEKN